MHNSFALDLRTARRRSGLTQRDCGHLLDTSERRIRDLERGKTLPSMPEICSLTLIFGRSFESLFGAVFDDLCPALTERLSILPDAKVGWRVQFNRRNTLNRLAERLENRPKRYA